MGAFKSHPTSDVKKKVKNRSNMLNIVGLILEFNQLNQSGQELKIVTPRRMLKMLSSIKNRK